MPCLSELIYKSAQLYGSLSALKIKQRLVSYEELNINALKLSSCLTSLGAEKEVIGLVGQKVASSYFGVLGIIYSGNIYTPLNPKYNPTRLREIVKNAGIRFLVGSVDDINKIESVLGKELSNFTVIIPEEKVPIGKNWISASTTILKRNTLPVITEDSNLAYILFTSGSTGKPKGVKVSHNNITSFVQSMASIYDLRPGFRASQVFDFSFDPSISDMFYTWYKGGILCVLPEEESLMPSDFIKREKIDFWNSVPSLASFMLRMGQLKKNSFPSLKFSMFCGEQFPKHVADAWREAAPNSSIENLYGPTEATIYISRYVYKIEDSEKEFKNSIIPIGTPFPGHKIAIIDDYGNRVKNGEICFKGNQITNGYLNDQIKTNEVFVSFEWDEKKSEKWYKTGDLGFINNQGDLECIGRKDSQIKIGGRRIEIGEIESVLLKFEKLKDIVVVAAKDHNNIVTTTVAFTTSRINKEEEVQIRQESNKYLERVFFPSKIIYIEEFPLSASGKIDRKALEELAKNF